MAICKLQSLQFLFQISNRARKNNSKILLNIISIIVNYIYIFSIA